MQNKDQLPEATHQAHFVDHCSHLAFQHASEDEPVDEFESHRGARYQNEDGTTIYGGPDECHRTSHQI